MRYKPVKMAAVGLGRGFSLSARCLYQHTGIELVAATDLSAESLSAFESTFGGTGYSDIHQMLTDSSIEVVYIATPHELHAHHAITCLNAGKHVVVEKPMAVDVCDACAVVECARNNNLHLLVGPSHSYDEPVRQAASIIASGVLGSAHLLHMLTATDFLYRPRRREELDVSLGGGIVYSQGVHQVDVAMRLLQATPVAAYARAANVTAERATESAFTAMVSFANGATATLTYSGNAYFNSDALMGDVSELGVEHRTPENRTSARQLLASTDDEIADKKARTFKGLANLPEPQHHEHFGQTLVFCERGDIQLLPDGVLLHRESGIEKIACPYTYSRASFADSIVQAFRGSELPPQTGSWGLTALATCTAILASARSGQSETIDTNREKS